jgi:hypothetical protein
MLGSLVVGCDLHPMTQEYRMMRHCQAMLPKIFCKRAAMVPGALTGISQSAQGLPCTDHSTAANKKPAHASWKQCSAARIAHAWSAQRQAVRPICRSCGASSQ